MTDPVGSALADSAIGKVLGVFDAMYKRASFTWRVARRAREAAGEDGYTVSLKALRLITRRKVVKAAVKSQRSADVAETMRLLADVRAERDDGTRLSPEQLFKLLRLGYLSAAEQVDRDLAIRDELNAGFQELILTGGSREALWHANRKELSPPLATDADRLRRHHGDGIDRLVQELVHAPDRAETLRSWAKTRPTWLTDEGRVLGWLGEFSFEVDARDAALLWFDGAVREGAVPIAYWKVRRMLVDGSLSDQDKIDSLADVADHPLVAAVTRGQFDERLHLVQSWSTETMVQASLRASLITQFLVDLVRFDEAIEFGRAAFIDESFFGAGIHAVEAYLRRSGYQPGAHAQDLTEAFALALRIRDARRGWGMSSGSPTAKAIRAAIMLSDPERAFALARPPQATEAEAAHPDVRREAAIAMALLGDVQQANEFIDEQTPEWVRLQIESREAELLDEQDRANELLSQSIAATDDWNEKARLCFRLAMRGVVHPFVEQLRESNTETVDELELTASLYARQPGAEEQARARILERPTLAFSLISYFEATGRRKDVIFVAEQAAQKWSDPELWLKAARSLLLEGESAQAIDRAAKALEVGGASWGSRADAYIVQIEAASTAGDWASALVSAQALVRSRPKSESARWALVRVQRSSGDLDQAWAAWKAGDPPPRPRDETEASVWFDFFRLHGSGMATLREFFEVVNEFAQFQQVRNLALGALSFAPLTEEVGELNAYALLEKFEREYPGEKHAMWKVTVDLDEPDTILQQLEAAAGPRNEQLQVLDEHIRRGTFPIGLAARAAGKHVAEVLSIRHKSPRFAGSLQVDDQQQVVEKAVASGALVDVTALFTLALLSEDDGNLLAAKFTRLISTSEQMLDASATREAFRRDVEGVLHPSSGDQDAYFRLDDPIERDVQRQKSGRLVEWFRRTERRSAHPISSDIAKRLGLGDDVWLTALDLAARTGMPLWCDDAATRLVAKEAGAQSFGTPALVEYLRRTGVISGDDANDVDADLIHNWVVGVAYRDDVFERAGVLDQLTPQGLAAAILHGGSDHALDKVNFMLRAMSAVTATPDQVADWAAVAFKYLSDIAGTPEAGFDNHIKLIHSLLVQPWMTPSCLLFVVNAGRAEVASRWAEAFREGFRRMFTQVVQQTDRPTAGGFALALIADLGPAERQLALEAVLAP